MKAVSKIFCSFCFSPLRSCRPCLLTGQFALPQTHCFPPCVSSTAVPLPDSGSYDKSNLKWRFCEVTGMPLTWNSGYQINTHCGCARPVYFSSPDAHPSLQAQASRSYFSLKAWGRQLLLKGGGGEKRVTNRGLGPEQWVFRNRERAALKAGVKTQEP